MTVDQLLDRFGEIGVAQDKALLANAIDKFNSLYDEKVIIVAELKSREGDQRRALMRLYNHQNMQVRLNAANATLAIAPDEARNLLQKIADSNFFPQAGDAGMSLWNLERGVYKPT
ncbi:MAG TPA: DUF2019 domain-containing protein [Xanthobacteraceae bacterium]|nr:DUF2019 domain-containing protein [Xanthobacteraceae bacterium]